MQAIWAQRLVNHLKNRDSFPLTLYYSIFILHVLLWRAGLSLLDPFQRICHRFCDGMESRHAFLVCKGCGRALPRSITRRDNLQGHQLADGPYISKTRHCLRSTYHGEGLLGPRALSVQHLDSCLLRYLISIRGDLECVSALIRYAHQPYRICTDRHNILKLCNYSILFRSNYLHSKAHLAYAITTYDTIQAPALSPMLINLHF